MVVGGNVDDGSVHGLTNSIELLTPNVEFANKCKKNVAPIFGIKLEIPDDLLFEKNFTANEFDATDMTGLFVKDAPIGN